MITLFHNENSFLSNFEPCVVKFENDFFPSLENAYQAAKTLDPEARKLFKKTTLTAGQAKRLGRKIPLRSDWLTVRLSIMEQLVRNKFTHNDVLKQKLIDTFPQLLIEGNNWNDTFWGVCNSIGENHLGMILMKIRAEVK